VADPVDLEKRIQQLQVGLDELRAEFGEERRRHRESQERLAEGLRDNLSETRGNTRRLEDLLAAVEEIRIDALGQNRDLRAVPDEEFFAEAGRRSGLSREEIRRTLQAASRSSDATVRAQGLIVERSFEDARRLSLEAAEERRAAGEAFFLEAVQHALRGGRAAFLNGEFRKALADAELAHEDLAKIGGRKRQTVLWAKVRRLQAEAWTELGRSSRPEEAGDRLREASRAYEEASRAFEEAGSTAEWARTQDRRATALQIEARRTDPTRSASLLEEAGKAYENALSIRTQSRDPRAWALTRMRLALVRREQAVRCEGVKKREGLENARLFLEEARETLESNCGPECRNRIADDWAAIFINLQNTRVLEGEAMGGEQGLARVEQAAREYRELLDDCPAEMGAYLRALVHLNLGRVLWSQVTLLPPDRGEVAPTLLREAANALRGATRAWHPDRYPQDWIKAQINLGNVYTDLARLVGGTVDPADGGDAAPRTWFDEAMDAYASALSRCDREHLPQTWAMIRNCRGYARLEEASRLGPEGALPLLRRAEQDFRQALEIQTRDALPEDWLLAQGNLCLTLRRIAELEEEEEAGGSATDRWLETAEVCRAAFDAAPHLEELSETLRAACEKLGRPAEASEVEKRGRESRERGGNRFL